jgi:uncharacterized protein YbbK (DUF523 family)
MKVIISACLLGVKCRYNGTSARSPSLLNKLKGLTIVPLCPEQLGGLPTPREESLIAQGTAFDVLSGKGRVLTKSGKDVTENFIRGAKESYKIALQTGAKIAYLKDRSPSCGVTKTYSKNGTIVKGKGVTAALFSLKRIKVCSV